MPKETGTDFDRTADAPGPFGSGDPQNNCMHKGKCSSASKWFDQQSIETIGRCALDNFDKHVNATFMWTAHNEIDARWDYIKAWDNGWINKTQLSPEKEARLLELRAERYE